MQYGWKPFLQTYSTALINSPNIEDYDLPPEVIESDWLGFAGATEAQIEAAETRLKRKLPPSYREFLSVTNGWRFPGPFIDKMWSVEEIDLFSVRNGQWIDIQSQFPNTSADEDDAFPPLPQLQAALEISEVGDSAIYLLNPLVVGPDGEWQAIFMASWIPGAYRYPSFWAMMQHDYELFTKFDSRDRRKYHPGEGPQVLLQKADGLIELLREEIAQFPEALWNTQDSMQQPYFAGWLDAIEETIRRVQPIIEQKVAPDELISALVTLADTLEKENRELDQKNRSSTDFAGLLRNLGQATSMIQSSGAIIGKQKAAATIRWLLGMR